MSASGVWPATDELLPVYTCPWYHQDLLTFLLCGRPGQRQRSRQLATTILSGPIVVWGIFAVEQ